MLLDSRHTSTPRSLTELTPPPDEYWTRIVPPGVQDPRARVGGPVVGMLTPIVAEILADDLATGIEILSYPGVDHQEVLLRPWSPISFPENESQPPTPGRPETVDSEIVRFAMVVKPLLVQRFGLELVRQDWTPLGQTPVLTDRLMSVDDRCVSLSTSRTESCFGTYLRTLTDTSIPTVVRMRLLPTDRGTCLLEQQIGYFDYPHRYLLPADSLSVLGDTPETTIADAYAGSDLTSLFLVLNDLLDKPMGLPESARDAYKARFIEAAFRPATDTALGNDGFEQGYEFDRLVGRSEQTEPLSALYSALSGTPTVEITPDSLPQYLGYVPNYEPELWTGPMCTDRSPPTLETVIISQEASGTQQSLTTPTQDPPQHRRTNTDQETPSFTTLTQTSLQRLKEYGDSVTEAHDDALADNTFVRTTPTGDSDYVVVGTRETLAAGDLIATVAAGSGSAGAVFITGSQADARWMMSRLRHPVQTAGEQTYLYTRRDQYWHSGEWIALILQGVTYTWQVFPDGTLELHADETVVATGDVNTGLTNITANVRWGRLRDTVFDVYHADGTPLATYQTYDAVSTQYQPVTVPAVPSRVSYLNHAAVFVLEEGRLVHQLPELQTGAQSGDWPRTELEAFLSDFTCLWPGDQLEKSAVGVPFQHYLCGLTNEVPPPAALVTKYLDDLGVSFQVMSHREDGSPVPEIRTRQWRYPLEATPDPFVETALTATDETARTLDSSQ